MTGEKMGGSGARLDDSILRAAAAGAAGATVVLVEGTSDQRAVEALAGRRGRDLEAEKIVVVPMAGASNIGQFLEILGSNGHDVPVAGLCDVAEAPLIRNALQRARPQAGGQLDLAHHGFFVCVNDLEEELIRSLGTRAMLDLIESEGQQRRFRSFQNQPAQRHKRLDAQIWRWLGNHKIRYAPLMVASLDLQRTPRPLDAVLAYAANPALSSRQSATDHHRDS